jgi:hypothetical protein
MALTAEIRREQTHSQSSIIAEGWSMMTTTIILMFGSRQYLFYAVGLELFSRITRRSPFQTSIS